MTVGEPELRARSEPMTRSKGGIACYAATPVDDLCHAIGRHVDLACEFGRSNAEFAQFIGEDFSWMDGGTRHGFTPFSGFH
jgi:hypothetical protein